LNSAPTPSKSSLKKAAKAERLAAVKLERRAREKAARKLKKRTTAEKRAAGELDSDEEKEAAARAAKRARLTGKKQPFGARVVIDVAFDDKMSERVRLWCG
jgi:tRNA (guanine9-N1)-methyltransferase